ncbi:ROK family protein [Sinorhizobium meliloti]|nr:ROK family protein [Sinorhizobium meliloti]
MASTLSVPVQLERDVVLQLLGESASGAIANECEVLAVYFGTGIGAAYLGENGIFRGGGWALEIGHMPVLEPGDRQESPSGSRRTPLVRLWWTSHLHMASP